METLNTRRMKVIKHNAISDRIALIIGAIGALIIEYLLMSNFAKLLEQYG